VLSSLQKGKLRKSKHTEKKILKIGRCILTPHIHKLLNLAIKKGFPKSWNQSLIVLILKEEIKNSL